MVALRRLFFVQPNLLDRHSHYYGEALGWQAACAARNLAARFYVHQAAVPEVRATFVGAPIFAYLADQLLDPDPVSRSLSDFLTIGDSFAASYDALARDGIGREDVVVVTFATDRDLYAASRWLAPLAPERRPAFVFIFHIPDITWTVDATGGNLAGDFSRWRYAIRQLNGLLPPERMALFATTATLAHALSSLLDRPCEAGPLPTFYLDPAVIEPVAAQLPRVNVRMAGDFRAERGADLVPAVIRRIAAQRPGTSFALQVYAEATARSLAAELDALGAHGSLCYIEYGVQEHADYQARLLQSDIVLLPYQWERYVLRASGVFSEAAAFGIVSVAPERTWMAAQLAEGWGAGMLFRDWTVEAIAAAAIAALEQYPALAARAARRAAEWRQRHCAAALLDRIAARLAW